MVLKLMQLGTATVQYRTLPHPIQDRERADFDSRPQADSETDTQTATETEPLRPDWSKWQADLAGRGTKATAPQVADLACSSFKTRAEDTGSGTYTRRRIKRLTCLSGTSTTIIRCIV